MVQKIALFNHKSSIGKTTTTLNLSRTLASKGKTVILVDADPQCNLTSMALGKETKIKAIYERNSNIKIGLAPAFESQPKAIEAVNCILLEGRENLFLLPGHIGFAEYEVTLSIAQDLSRSIYTLKNLLGSITDLLDKTAKKYDADYIIIEMHPSLGAINQNLLMTSDFFIVPTNTDLFSVMAIDSLAQVLPKWHKWAKKASSIQILKEANYPFPDITLRFLGTIVQNYQFRDQETNVFEEWIQNIEQVVTNKLVPVLRENNMMFPEYLYTEHGISQNFTLTEIPNFNSNLKEFRKTVSDLADKVIGLTSPQYAVST